MRHLFQKEDIDRSTGTLWMVHSLLKHNFGQLGFGDAKQVTLTMRGRMANCIWHLMIKSHFSCLLRYWVLVSPVESSPRLVLLFYPCAQLVACIWGFWQSGARQSDLNPLANTLLRPVCLRGEGESGWERDPLVTAPPWTRCEKETMWPYGLSMWELNEKAHRESFNYLIEALNGTLL